MEGGESAEGASNRDEKEGVWEEHPNMLTSMDNLAWTWEWQGRRMRIASRWFRLPTTGL
jgi:hypothetical protein